MKALVVGAGSIGKRHLNNLKTLGVDGLGAVDVRPDRRAEVTESLGVTAVYESVEEALAESYDAVIVGVPTRYHVEVAQKAIDAGAHVLIEKPISDSLEQVDHLLEKAATNDLVVMVGYTYRFWPPLIQAKRAIDAGEIGRVYSAQITFSEYLPDWHPWEDYRSWFMARRDQGGGAILDESHTIDIARWFFGDVDGVFCVGGTVSELEIDADDLAEMVLTFRSGVVANVHMDIYGRKHRKTLSVYGEKGNIDWDFYENRVSIYHADQKATQSWNYNCDRNDMFLEQVKCFLGAIDGKDRPPVDGYDAVETLRVIRAGIESAESGSMVRLPNSKESSK